MRILITGGAGAIGSMMRTRMVRPGRTLVLFDPRRMPPAGPDEPVETVVGDITDPDALAAAMANCDAVIHLGGIPLEETWENINRINVDGTRNVLVAAQQSGVQRVLFASSNHAVGMYPRTPGLTDDVQPRPDTYYGYSKAAGEALGALFAERYGMTVFGIRIGWCTPVPVNEFGLAMWLSPDDCARLFEACLKVTEPGFRTIWGASRNTRRYWSYAGGDAIGYDPRDDSEAYAAQAEQSPEIDERTRERLGGFFAVADLGVPMGDNPS